MNLVVPSARGGRKPTLPLEITIVRDLSPDDLPQLAQPIPADAPRSGMLVKLRHGHHLLAQALAKGMKPGEAALATGYCLSRISVLQGDPAFAELLAHYRDLADVRFIDVAERMKGLGLTAMDEIQDRLDTTPEGFSNRELMELADLMLVKGKMAPQGGSAGAPAIMVQFISSESGVTIDGEVSRA
jgi:hypothetical protein